MLRDSYNENDYIYAPKSKGAQQNHSFKIRGCTSFSISYITCAKVQTRLNFQSKENSLFPNNNPTIGTRHSTMFPR